MQNQSAGVSGYLSLYQTRLLTNATGDNLTARPVC